MPQQHNQADFTNWTTPYIDGLLRDDETPFGEQQLAQIQDVLETILHQTGYEGVIVDGRSMPHYALFQIQVQTQYHDSLAQQLIQNIAHHAGWIVGVYPHPETPNALNIFIRTGDHRPITLKQVLTRQPFRKTDSARNLVLGVTLEQHVMIRDLEVLQHLIVSGDHGTTRNIVRSLLATLLLTNTPANLRIAFIGTTNSDYLNLSDTPHVLGKYVNQASDGIRLLGGMVREVRRRQSHFRKVGCSTIDDYNSTHPQAPLPRIVMVIDTLETPTWMAQHEAWLTNLTRLIRSGATLGVHMLLVVSDLSNELLHPLYATVDTKLMARTIARDYARQIDNFHDSLWRFVDAVLVEHGIMRPIEIPVTAATDTSAIAVYWRKNAEDRIQSGQFGTMPQKSGLTMLFQKLQTEAPVPAPPVPQTPPLQILAHAATVLSGGLSATQTAKELDTSETIAVQHEADMDDRMVSQAIIEHSSEVSIQMEAIRRAHALASYLGWLGRGPLMDILGLSTQEAGTIISILQARQILERSDTPTPRLRSSRNK